jgi:hypothetical protein
VRALALEPGSFGACALQQQDCRGGVGVLSPDGVVLVGVRFRRDVFFFVCVCEIRAEFVLGSVPVLLEGHFCVDRSCTKINKC